MCGGWRLLIVALVLCAACSSLCLQCAAQHSAARPIVVEHASLSESSAAPRCVHDELQARARASWTAAGAPRGVRAKSHARVLAQSFGAIRVVADFTYLYQSAATEGYTCFTPGATVATGGMLADCGQSDVLTPGRRDHLINDVWPRVQHFFADTVRVNSLTTNLQLSVWPSRAQCNVDWLPLPAALVSPGPGVPSADLVLLFTSAPAAANVLAWAVDCGFQSSEGRPLVGLVNVPAFSLDSFSFDAQVTTIRHEIVHVLGFTSETFSAKSMIQPFQEQGRVVTKITSANTLAAARALFNCSSLNGAELENAGGAGTAGSHWEERVLLGEFMNGELPANPIFSVLTLSVLQDLGYYQVNPASMYVHSIPFALNKGCAFATGSCSADWPALPQLSGTTGYFGSCRTACSFDRSGYGGCSGSPLLDGCHVTVAAVNGVCSSLSLAQMSVFGESSGPSSVCMSSTMLQAGYSTGSDSGVRCHTVRCDSSTYSVWLPKPGSSGVWVTCPAQGGPVSGSGYSGQILCLPYSAMCGTPRDPCLAKPCRNRGLCISTPDLSSFTCQCAAPYAGSTCEGNSSGIASSTAPQQPQRTAIASSTSMAATSTYARASTTATATGQNARTTIRSSSTSRIASSSSTTGGATRASTGATRTNTGITGIKSSTLGPRVASNATRT